jgi:hypothetical protein
MSPEWSNAWHVQVVNTLTWVAEVTLIALGAWLWKKRKQKKITELFSDGGAFHAPRCPATIPLDEVSFSPVQSVRPTDDGGFISVASCNMNAGHDPAIGHGAFVHVIWSEANELPGDEAERRDAFDRNGPCDPPIVLSGTCTCSDPGGPCPVHRIGAR